MAAEQQTAPGFTGTARYELRRVLGRGGMGCVYEAWDRERELTVALKVMRDVDVDALVRFKQEFRALADVSHPNLVTLYELASDHDTWFFTMELVKGVPFIDYIRPRDETGASETASLSRDDATAETGSFAEPATQGPERVRARSHGSQLDERRLRQAMRQLAAAVAALHDAGRLHRDLKPSNVLVTPEGRVVVCDFGLVQLFKGEDAAAAGEAAGRRISGTLAFMSPEQAAGMPQGPASDWYSVGVMLYQALAGVLPFTGAPLAVRQRKQVEDPVPPRELAAVPADLDGLCVQLLRRDPARRPSAAAVLAHFGAEAPAASLSDQDAFVGRTRLLAGLLDAFAAVSTGPVVALVRGVSGMGKSALTERFLAGIARADNALVLRGRCYERETVPYKAFDTVVDSLAAHLAARPADEARALLPDDTWALARVFPVLGRFVPLVKLRGAVAADVPDPQELRKRAFTALRDLVAALGRDRRVVIHIDDLQWGDLDSGRLLMELLRGELAPPVLVVAAYRQEEELASPLLARLLGAGGELAALADVRVAEVGALDPAEAVELVRALEARDERVTRQAARIAHEAAGSPLLVRELVRYVRTGDALADEGAARVSLASVLEARTGRLPPDARYLLSVVAVAGRPIAQRVAQYAASQGEEFLKALATLRAEHLVRTGGARDVDSVETYHDRVREVVAGQLPRLQLRQIHARLALALQWAGSTDHEALFEHWLGAESHAPAAEQAVRAADAAAATLAFDRAARLYHAALDLGDFTAERVRTLRIALADALANAGRGPDAAEAYLAAAAGTDVPPAQALECRRRAAEKLLQSGHIDRALELVVPILREVGEVWPRSAGTALVRLLAWRAWLGARGLGLRERPAAELPPALLLRLDTLWSVGTGLTTIDTIRGLYFEVRHARLAFACGEPVRVARSLAWHGGSLAVLGAPSFARATRYWEAARALAERTGDLHTLALNTATRGVGTYLSGRFKEAAALCEEAGRLLRDHCTDVFWERDSAFFFHCGALFFLGELRRLHALVPAHLRENEERGNLYGATGIRSWRTNVAWLVGGDPAEARRQVSIAHAQWSRAGFHVQHYYELLANCQIDLYEGDAAAALERVEATWPALERSFLLRVQSLRVESAHLRARCAIAAAAARGGDPRLVARARKQARRIEAEGLPWTRAVAALTRAGAAAAAGEAEESRRWLGETVVAAEAADMRLHAMVARWRLGGVDAASARAWMAEETVAEPDRFVAMLAPGWR